MRIDRTSYRTVSSTKKLTFIIISLTAMPSTVFKANDYIYAQSLDNSSTEVNGLHKILSISFAISISPTSYSMYIVTDTTTTVNAYGTNVRLSKKSDVDAYNVNSIPLLFSGFNFNLNSNINNYDITDSQLKITHRMNHSADTFSLISAQDNIYFNGASLSAIGFVWDSTKDINSQKTDFLYKTSAFSFSSTTMNNSILSLKLTDNHSWVKNSAEIYDVKTRLYYKNSNDPTWMNGTWYNGSFTGTWYNGKFKKGNWVSGSFLNGTMGS